MTNFKILYNYPWLLLLVIPAVLLGLIPHFLTEKKYRRTRNRIVSLVAFLLASILAINLLAGVSFSYENPNENNELIVLVDVSDSGETERKQKDELVESIVSISDGDFNVGIVKFGYDQVYASELSANTDKVLSDYYASAEPDTTASDIASALEYAASLLSFSFFAFYQDHSMDVYYLSFLQSFFRKWPVIYRTYFWMGINHMDLIP